MNEDDALIERLRSLGRQPIEPGVAGRHLGAMATVAVHRRWPVRLKVGTAFFAGLLLGGTGLASAGALPTSAQDVAHTTLSKVGVHVPEGTQRFTTGCGTDPATGQPYRNHGQYVKAHKSDPNAATSQCGKPIQAGKPDTSGTTKDTEGPETTEKPETSQGGGPATNPGKGNKANKGQGDQGDQADQADGNEAPETTTPAGAAPKSVTTTVPPTTSTSTSSTSTTSTTSTTAHP